MKFHSGQWMDRLSAIEIDMNIITSIFILPYILLHLIDLQIGEKNINEFM